MKMKTKLFAGMALSALAISPAYAQDSGGDGAAEDDVIVVTGFRKSLQDSINLKRESSAVVDAISAEDVGKFPDTNVAESLQRITGVAIDRSGGEGQFITVRGLGPEFNAVLLNGRTIATDNNGREFSFDILSADIIQTAEVYKSAQPSLQSGGIGSVVNISTAKPLDRPSGLNISASAAGIYEDLSDDIGADFSSVLSWTDGTFGLLLGGSYSTRNAQIDRFRIPDGFTLRSGDQVVNAPEGSVGLDNTVIGALPDGTRVQQNAVFERDFQDRDRLTLNGALQWAPSDDIQFTVDALYSQFEIDSFATQFSGFFNPAFIEPVIDGNGTVTRFTRPSVDFLNRNPLLNVENPVPEPPDVDPNPLDADVGGSSQNDNVITSNNRDAKTFAVGGNLDWQASDSLKFVFDASYSRAENDATNPFVVLGALAQVSPTFTTDLDDGITVISGIPEADFVDRDIQRLHFVNVDRQELEDEIFELRFDGEWDVDKGPLKAVTFGGIYTDRTKELRRSNNFAAPDFVSSTGATLSTSEIFCAFCGYTVAPDTSIFSDFSLGGFLDGVPGANSAPQTILTSTFEQAFAQLNNLANINNPARTGGNTAALIEYLNSPGIDPVFGIYTPTFNPSQSFAVDETIVSAYFNTEWGGEFGGDLPWSANIGFRIAFTDVSSSGVDQPVIEFTASTADTQLEPVFGPATPTTVTNDYVNFLPSVNFRIEPSDDMVLRLGYARTVTRPTLTALGVANTFSGRSDAPLSGGGNPFLEAFVADNFDVSFEWYFDNLSFFSIAGFHKELSGFIENETVLIPGVVRLINPDDTIPDIFDDVQFQDTRQRNAESGSISGVEIALQKTFENGFGAIANYTFVTSSRDDVAAGAEDLDFNGFTPHTFNLTGFYEDDRFSARVSYNYRDGFLFARSGPASEPQFRESFGQVDFSASYNVNDNFQIFLEGINVLGETSRDFSRFRNRVLEVADTGARYTAGVRATF